MSHRNRIPNCVDQVPAHIKAAWSTAERRYYVATYKTPRSGPDWITAHRQIEMQMADILQRDFFAGYWPHEARDGLERFKRSHFDNQPESRMDDSIARRISTWYPQLFSLCLDPRMVPLFEATGTHPFLRECHTRYETLRDQYLDGLKAADTRARIRRPGVAKKKRQHDDYRAVFDFIYEPLHDLLDDICALRDRQKRGSP